MWVLILNRESQLTFYIYNYTWLKSLWLSKIATVAMHCDEEVSYFNWCIALQCCANQIKLDASLLTVKMHIPKDILYNNWNSILASHFTSRNLCMFHRCSKITLVSLHWLHFFNKLEKIIATHSIIYLKRPLFIFLKIFLESHISPVTYCIVFMIP